MIIANNTQAESVKLNSDRDSMMTGGADGQSASTEAGESPREAKPQANAASKAQAPVAGEELLPGVAKEPVSLKRSQQEDVAIQRPEMGDPGKVERSGVSRVPGAEQTSSAPSEKSALSATGASGVRKRVDSTTPAVARDSGTTKTVPAAATSDEYTHQKLTKGLGEQMNPQAIPATSPAMLSSTTGVHLPLLALGHPATGVGADRTNLNMLPQASHVPSGHASSQLSIPNVAGQPKGKASASLRRGKWTVEEEAYVARVIQDFNSGFLNAPAGTTLRSYLSEKLQCDPMRITKKFTGDSCIGKRVFHPAVRNPSNAGAIDKAQAELDSLERRWRRRLEMQQRESAKKAAASAAAAAAASGRSHGFITQGALAGTGAGHNGTVLGGQNTASANGVTQTASWLDRASNILKGTGSQAGVSVPCSQQKFSLTQEQAQALQSLPKKEIEMQMKEVERLIHEGPIIQQTSAGLPLALNQSAPDLSMHPSPPVPTTIVASTPGAPASDGQQTPPEPADKRMRTGAEDAEALVGFLTAVRASAAAGTDSL